MGVHSEEHVKVTRSLVSAAAVVALTAVPASAGHSWGPYHWARVSNPFTVSLGDNASSAWDGHLATASGDWSVSAELDTAVVAGTTKPQSCKATLGKVQVCSAKYGFNGWLGLATIWISGEHIVQGTVKVNDTYFNTSYYNKPEARQHVMCQEVGHTLGLGHQEAGTDSCMNDRDRLFDPAAAHPNQHDYDQLATTYAHTDSTTTVAQSTSGAGYGGARWSRDGGYRVVQFIVWAR